MKKQSRIIITHNCKLYMKTKNPTIAFDDRIFRFVRTGFHPLVNFCPFERKPFGLSAFSIEAHVFYDIIKSTIQKAVNNMIPTLAEELYANALRLKRYTSKCLFWGVNRSALQKDLLNIQKLTKMLITELHRHPDYSDNYYRLAEFMEKTLEDCMMALSSKEPHYREAVSRIAFGFHNLPRAFLSIQSPLKLSPEEAQNYFRPYTKEKATHVHSQQSTTGSDCPD